MKRDVSILAILISPCKKYKNIKMSSFKSSKNIQKKESGPDRSVSDSQSFSYKWLDNVKILKYTKFEPNIPSGSRVMSILTKRARPAK